MKKQKPIVSIPAEYTCVPVYEILSTNTELIDLHRSNADMQRRVKQQDAQIEELTKKLAEASQKIVDLEKKVEAKDESVMFWYRRSNELEGKIKEAANACTEKT